MGDLYYFNIFFIWLILYKKNYNNICNIVLYLNTINNKSIILIKIFIFNIQKICLIFIIKLKIF